MAYFPDGTIVEGMVFSASDNDPYYFGDGCLFTSCYFLNPCYFGKGCVFIGCQIQDGRNNKNTQPNITGDGCIFDENTQVHYTITGVGNVWGGGYQVGVRPNVPGLDNVFIPVTKKTPKTSHSQTGNNPCGVLVVHENGPKYVGPLVTPEEEVVG